MKAALSGLMMIALLAACGADGVPETPSDDPVKTGITISGSARVGVTKAL